jgi:hypothetical protein
MVLAPISPQSAPPKGAKVPGTQKRRKKLQAELGRGANSTSPTSGVNRPETLVAEIPRSSGPFDVAPIEAHIDTLLSESNGAVGELPRDLLDALPVAVYITDLWGGSRFSTRPRLISGVIAPS